MPEGARPQPPPLSVAADFRLPEKEDAPRPQNLRFRASGHPRGGLRVDYGLDRLTDSLRILPA